MNRRFTTPNRHSEVRDFRAHLQGIDPSFDADDVVEGADGPLGQPIAIGGRTAGNRFCIQPMEGWDATPDGAPTELTLRRWRRFGESGAKLVWGGEAFSVRRDGRANPAQLYFEPAADNAARLAELRSMLLEGHRATGATAEDLVVGLQITHSGRWARPDGTPAPRAVVRHPVLDERFDAASLHVMTDGELEELVEDFVRAARLARDVGFDFVDVKACHGYLLHELLGARDRPGRYGGSFANRTRLLRDVVRAVRRECPEIEVGVRLSLIDALPHVAGEGSGIGEPTPGWGDRRYTFGFGIDVDPPHGFDLDEPLRLLADLSHDGARLVNVSAGCAYYAPHLLRPAAYPPSDGYRPPRDPLADVVEHLRATRAAKAACPELIVVGSGYTYLQEYLAHVAQHEVRHGHVDFVGLGRMTLIYPDLPRDVLARKPIDRRRICRTFSDCTTAARHDLPSGCYPLDDHYRELPSAKELAEIKRRTRRMPR